MSRIRAGRTRFTASSSCREHILYRTCSIENTLCREHIYRDLGAQVHDFDELFLLRDLL